MKKKPTPNKIVDSPAYRAALKAQQNNEFIKAENKFITSFRLNETKAREALLFALQYSDARGNESLSMTLLNEAATKFQDADTWLAALAERHMRVGDFINAIQTIDAALKINPNNETAFINRVCWLAGQEGDSKKSRALFESWGRKFMDPISDQSASPPPTDRSPTKKLNVGYVSGDFRNHSVRYFIEAYLQHHDRTKFVIHAFMTLPEDEVTELIRPLVDHWHDAATLSDDAMFKLIKKENIDILVDLSGHTAGERLAVFARKPAPIQITWLGFMQTLGMKAMEWRLTDFGATPPGNEKFYTEKLQRLACMATYTPPRNCEEEFDAPYLSNGHVTMACLNHSRKISDKILQIWRNILSANKNSGLIVISSLVLNNKIDDHQLRDRLQKANLPMKQVFISSRLMMTDFMRMASIADFALDTMPISGGTTTLHALWMGLPTLAMQQPSKGARTSSTAGTLLGVGLTECVVNSEAEYVQKATEWIQSPEKISILRKKCRSALKSSLLMQYTTQVLELESIYRTLWVNFVNKTSDN